MGRKRLLTLLTAISAAIALQAGPAAAQISAGGLEADATGSEDDEDCVRVGVDVSLSEALKLDPSACVLDEDGDTLDVDGGAAAGDQKTDLDEATEPATDAVNETTESAKDAARDTVDRASGGGSDPDANRDPSGSEGGGSSSDDGSRDTSSRDTSQRSADERTASSEDDVVVAGSARDFRATERRAEQGDLLVQLREDLAAQRRSDVTFGPVAPGVGDPGLAAPPEVADGFAAGVEPGVEAPQAAPGTVTPEVTAPDPERRDAVLATGSSPTGQEIPAALQLLTGAMVLGAASVWYLARREYGVPSPTAS